MSDDLVQGFKDLRAQTRGLMQELSNFDEGLSALVPELDATGAQPSTSKRQATSSHRRLNSLPKLREQLEDSKHRIDQIFATFNHRLTALEDIREAQGIEAYINSTKIKDTAEGNGDMEETTDEEKDEDIEAIKEVVDEAVDKAVHPIEADTVTPSSRRISHTGPKKDMDQPVVYPVPLRYKCRQADLSHNMVSTILRARSELGHETVSARGYLILTTDVSINSSELAQSLRTAELNKEDYIAGFAVTSHQAGYLQVGIDTTASPDLSRLTGTYSQGLDASDPELVFQTWTDQPEDRVRYLIGPPPIDNYFANDLLSAGPNLNQRPTISGVNTTYWYISEDADTPAPIHTEDGCTGSANMLLSGSLKQWLMIHRHSVSKFEQCIRNEFPQSKHCSQFVRHLNIIPSPRWLKERGIQFEIVNQNPGEVFCTLPGPTYHAVHNVGPNVAIAINYEFPNTPEVPPGYSWCLPGKGMGKCGEHVITLESFRFQTQEEKGKVNTQRSQAISQEIITLSDDDESKEPGLSPSTFRLPEPVADPIKDVSNLIKACLDQHVAPQWFGCPDQNQLDKKLQRFLPGRWLSDDLLQSLLQMIAFPSNFCVRSSLGVDIDSPEVEEIRKLLERAGNNIRGIVMPFHVSIGQKTRRSERNHWVVGIFDQATKTFFAYGIEESVAKRWAHAIKAALLDWSGEQVAVTTKSYPLPPNPDGASCGLCCCLAVERVLGTLLSSKEPINIRPYYLRRLLGAYRISTQYGDVCANSLSVTRRTFETQSIAMEDVNICAASQEFEPDQTGLSQTDVQIVQRALEDSDCTLTKDRRWRILQMIMQCSIENFENLVAAPQDTLSPAPLTISADQINSFNAILLLVNELQESSKEFLLPCLHYRMRLIELHVFFESRIHHEKIQISRTRAIRKRQQAAGEKLDALPKFGMMPRNRVLDAIIALDKNEPLLQKRLRRRLTTYVNSGSILYLLALQLGLGLLLALPSSSVYHCDLKLHPLNSPRDCKPLEPSEYHTMSEDEAKFFVRWLPLLKTQIQEWDRAWSNEFFPRSAFWQRDIAQIASHLRETYCLAQPSIAAKRGIGALPLQPDKKKKKRL